ncbi:HAMP domain-containing sensor histidine kinase [Bacillus sp. FJAT-50079]|uniref:sensor histidine kinase n=1 Tax=Bacillus sp. FJAT-50079 TaxID=2833577 RepID=UPI001BC90562|nr:HAMP domain-containing sensor histidine kinase [Bacillus sp. FJAT-50079]MBS4206887.1 HAMP domain-containing histidine kinase [Bacillus sp. FJAT-50079]
MIFLSLLCIVVLIFFIYKNMRSSSIFFLSTLTISWILAYISFTLYLSKFNYYFNIVNQFIDFSPGTWNNLVLRNFDGITLIRLFNFGIILFYFSFLCFAVSFVEFIKNKRKQIYVYSILGIFGLIQFIYYDPSVHLLLQDYAVTMGKLRLYHLYSNVGDTIFQTINLLHIIGGLFLFAYHFILYYKLRYIRHYTLYNVVSLLPLTLLHLLIFYWAPNNFVKITFSESYINYLQPPLHNALFEYRFFPLLALFAVGLMIYNVFKYKAIESRYSSINVITKKKLDTASLGVRAFTHAIKNHLLAIRSEAEYLQEKLADDEDALYSLKLMIDACENSFQSINEANEKLRSITLNMKPVPLSVPIKKALERFHAKTLNVNLHFPHSDRDTIVYIDEEYVQEAIYNILKNSVEAVSNKHGDVWIKMEEVGQWGTIIITDNGPGIDAENIDEIFTPFFSTKPSITNWGIGLSFCHKVITAHGGKIEVTSEKGKKTQFDILLPIVNKL